MAYDPFCHPENDGTNRPITYTIYDNLGETVEQDQYDGDGVAITSTAGVPNAPSASLLVSKILTSYDDQGREYQSRQYSVDPATGAVSADALTSEIFYDHRGDEIATSDPSGLWTKTVFDGAERSNGTGPIVLAPIMRDEPQQPPIALGRDTVRPGINRVFAGAVGITKAALHVDRADEVGRELKVTRS